MICEKNILKNYILYFLAFIVTCIIGVSDVFAWRDYANPVELRDVTQQLVSTDYLGNPIDNPLNGGYAFGSVIQVDYIVNNYNFSANTNYQLESHLGNQQFTNVDAYRVYGLNGEDCIISYTNSILNNDAYPRWAFQCPHATNTVTISIYNTNNSYLWSGTSVFSWLSAVLWTSPNSLPTQSSDTDLIINNQNQNTQNIINNNNQNTQDIIDANNQNTQDIIDNQNEIYNKCEETYLPGIFTSVILTTNGAYRTITDNSSLVFDVSNYKGKSAVLTFSNLLSDRSPRANYCFTQDLATSSNQNCISYSISTNSVTDFTYNLTIPNNANYLYIVGYVGNANITSLKNNVTLYLGNICTNRLDDQTNAINDLNDSLNDDDSSGATSEASDFFSSFSTNTFGLTSIITAPLNLINSVLSSTCSNLELPLPYLDNKKLILPCMTSIYSQYFGTFFTIYQTITYGIIAYWVCVRIFNQVKDFKNPEHDEIEVMDL